MKHLIIVLKSRPAQVYSVLTETTYILYLTETDRTQNDTSFWGKNYFSFTISNSK